MKSVAHEEDSGQVEYTKGDLSRLNLATQRIGDALRASGAQTGGPSALSQRDRQLFAKHLDHYLTHLAKAKNGAE